MSKEFDPSFFVNPSPDMKQHLEAFQKAQFNAIGEGVLSVNTSGKVLLSDKIIREALGISPGDHLNELLPKLWATVEDTFQDRNRRFVVSLQISDMAFLVMISPILMGLDMVGATCVFVENSDLEQMAKEMRTYQELNKELLAIINASSEGLWVSDANANVLRLNPASERINQLKSVDVVGRNIQELVDEGILEESVTQKVIQKKSVINSLQVKHGRKLITTGTPVFNDENKLIRVVVSERDITEIDNLQHELEEKEALNDQIQHHIAEIQKEKLATHTIIAKSPCMIKTLRQAIKVSPVDSTVLILGESGVGKGLFADLIHKYSDRSEKPIIKINCGAIPESLIESELFGHEKGAFTGAQTAKPGYLEMADGGILFLDEIAELPLGSQVKLLRFLEDGQIMRVGGTKSRNVNIRILTATHRNLEEMVEQGTFRLDLFYRLNVIPLRIPPLRERKECLLPLIRHFIESNGEKAGVKKRLSRETTDALLSYSFPGNIRELMNICERLVVMSERDLIGTEDLPLNIISNLPNRGDVDPTSGGWSEGMSLQHALDNTERIILKKSLEIFGTQRKAARALGVNQSTITRKLQKYGLENR
ncbi:MAG: sigma 54-interacting transcriptional regulator [Desulfuromonadales bacterium]|nr:sigma 54-interacting transcriptional regulator [Desulfuromonadales bacterium]